MNGKYEKRNGGEGGIRTPGTVLPQTAITNTSLRLKTKAIQTRNSQHGLKKAPRDLQEMPQKPKEQISTSLSESNTKTITLTMTQHLTRNTGQPAKNKKAEPEGSVLMSENCLTDSICHIGGEALAEAERLYTDAVHSGGFPLR